MKIEIQNTKACFVALWQRLERTRQLFGRQYKRFCIRKVDLKALDAAYSEVFPESTGINVSKKKKPFAKF